MKKEKRYFVLVLTTIVLGIMGLSHLIVSLLSFPDTDNFQWCDRTIIADKQEYEIGDTITLTVTIKPTKQEKKEIRVYENFRNFSIWPTFHRQCNDTLPQLCSFPVDSTIEIKKDKVAINKYFITPDKPFSHSFTGTITESNDKRFYIIKFPDLGTYYIDKLEYQNSVDFGFYGFWMPINPNPGDSLEDYTTFCRIGIKEKITVANSAYSL